MVGFLLLAVAGALLWVRAERFVTYASSAARSLRTRGLAAVLVGSYLVYLGWLYGAVLWLS